jgi:hypothetical protein
MPVACGGRSKGIDSVAGKPNGQPTSGNPPESQSAEAITVAWTLATLTAAACDVGALATRLIYAAQPALVLVGAVAGVLLFSALVAGIATLVLTPLVYRVRRVSPPRAFTIFAVIVAVCPIVGAVLSTLTSP